MEFEKPHFLSSFSSESFKYDKDSQTARQGRPTLNSVERSKFLVNGGELKIDLRTESGLMTGRRTLFFMEANWPAEVLQQKETEDIKIFYYPGTRNVDWEPDDPTKLWLTEEFFPGTQVYLEVQCWSQCGDKMQFISKCNKHGNIIKVATPSNSKNKDVSDTSVNWKGTSLPKVAICFCCTPSCFKKMDPFMFIRMRFGQIVYQSQWFQLVFRKSTKRKRSSSREDEASPKVCRNEELAIHELSSFSTQPCPVTSSSSSISPPSRSPEHYSSSIPIPDRFANKLPDPFLSLSSSLSSSPLSSSSYGSPLANFSSSQNIQSKSSPQKVSDVQQLLCGDLDVARSLLKLEENVHYRQMSQSKLQSQWEALERAIIESRSAQNDGSSYCIDLLRALTSHVKDYDAAKEMFLKWIQIDRGVQLAKLLAIFLPIVREPWFHGQPLSTDEFEKRLLHHSAMNVGFDKRPFAITLQSDGSFKLDIIGLDHRTIHSDVIKVEEDKSVLGFRSTNQCFFATSITELLTKSPYFRSDCVPLSRYR